MQKQPHTKQPSFFITDETLSETQKVALRQELACELTHQNSENFKDLFACSVPQEVVGKKNCENLIGSVTIPVGVAGPVTCGVAQSADVNKVGLEKRSELGDVEAVSAKNKTAQRTFIIPLATTEGALVASIQRGMKALNAGATTIVVQKVGMSRSVVFEAGSTLEALAFTSYFAEQFETFKQWCEATSTHLKTLSFEHFSRGKLLYYRFVFDTDEAMGMNMVTIALAHALELLQQHLPPELKVRLLAISGNVCTDKKDAVINRQKGRGYFVTAETVLTRDQVLEILKTTPEEVVKTHVVKNMIGSNVAGSFSQNMHVANALAAVYLATGQDMAHVVAGSEASVHFEVVDDSQGKNYENGLYVALTLPNVSVGSIGGGTWLPAQKQARALGQMETAADIATVAGIACLAGEISGLAAITTHSLAKAHQKLGRQ